MVFSPTNFPYMDSVLVESFYRQTGKGGGFQAGEWDGYYVKSLKPNTQYWWSVTPGIAGCGVQIYADTWTFTTGAGGSTPTTYYGCVNNTCQVISGATGNTDR